MIIYEESCIKYLIFLTEQKLFIVIYRKQNKKKMFDL